MVWGGEEKKNDFPLILKGIKSHLSFFLRLHCRCVVAGVMRVYVKITLDERKYVNFFSSAAERRDEECHEGGR